MFFLFSLFSLCLRTKKRNQTINFSSCFQKSLENCNRVLPKFSRGSGMSNMWEKNEKQGNENEINQGRN